MKGPSTLTETEDRWVTDLGAWFPGERVVYRGKDLLRELGSQRWMGLLLYGITGRLFDDHQLRLFEGIWVLSTSYPDPRLWNNRVAALAGTTRSTAGLSTAAALAVSEATIYGHRPIIRAMDLLLRLRQALDAGAELLPLLRAELKKYRTLPGYGRPVTRTDERIAPLLGLARELGLAEGPYVKLALAIEDALLTARLRQHMNVAALAAALAADQGLRPQEYYRYLILCFSAGFLPCFIDAAERPEGSFFPLRCNRIQYEGSARRSWHEDASPPPA